MSLPPVRLVSTGHNHTVHSDGPLPQFHPRGPDGPAFSILDVRPSVPVSNSHPPSRASFSHTIPYAPPEGFSATILDLPGNYVQTSNHRTLSVDYIFVVSGEISLGLKGEEEVLLRAGDFVQIQGSDHRWMNKAEKACRMLCFSAGAGEVGVTAPTSTTTTE